MNQTSVYRKATSLLRQALAAGSQHRVSVVAFVVATVIVHFLGIFESRLFSRAFSVAAEPALNSTHGPLMGPATMVLSTLLQTAAVVGFAYVASNSRLNGVALRKLLRPRIGLLSRAIALNVGLCIVVAIPCGILGALSALVDAWFWVPTILATGFAAYVVTGFFLAIPAALFSATNAQEAVRTSWSLMSGERGTLLAAFALFVALYYTLTALLCATVLPFLPTSGLEGMASAFVMVQPFAELFRVPLLALPGFMYWEIVRRSGETRLVPDTSAWAF